MEKLYKIIGISCVVLFILFFISINSTPKFNIPDEKQAKENAQWVNNNYMRFASLQKKLGDDASPEELKQRLTECVSQMDIDRCEKVIKGIVFMGEPELWVLSSIGVYTHINTTVVNGLTRDQWTYGNGLAGTSYYYFDNRILTGWQTSD